MLSTCDEFNAFVDFLIGKGFIDEHQIDVCLQGFGGLSGAIRDEYYISSYEEIGRFLVRNNNIEYVMKSLSQAGCFTASSEQYYFFWAVFDEYVFNKGDLRVLLTFTPEGYLKFLRGEFRIV